MDRQISSPGGPQVSPQAFAARMQETTTQLLQEVMAAVNRAADGAWINDSEMQVRDLLGEYRRAVFETALQMKSEAAEGAFSPADLRQLTNKGAELRSTLTANGRVNLRRRRWQRRQGGGSVVPADPLLDAAEATISRGARRLCCDLNATGRSFRRTAQNLKQAAQLPISAESLRQLVETEGRRVLAAQESAATLPPAWKAADCRVGTPGGAEVSRVYLGMDGFMVPVLTEAEKQARRKQVVDVRSRRGKHKPKLAALPRRRRGADQRYKEFKLVQFHDESMEHRLLSVTRGDCQEAGRILRRDAGRITFHDADERVGIVDGAAWIAGQIACRCILLSVLLLDFYHLGTHVNQGKRATYGETNPEGQQWANDLMHTARHEGYDPFWERLLAWRSGQRSKPKRQEADQLLDYASGHRDMIRYELCEQRGWRIGSSTTESECGVVPARVKGPGKRWDAANAEAVIALEAMHQSNQSNDYWSTCACSVS